MTDAPSPRCSSGMETALRNLIGAAQQMPRQTPAPGGASTLHHYELSAAAVWGLDKAIKEASEALKGITTVAQAAPESVTVAWRYGRKEWKKYLWRIAIGLPTFETPDDWIVEPLYAVPQHASNAYAQPKWRHLKRGSIVTEIARGFAQVAHHPIEEMTCVVIYRHDDDGRYWVRNAVEFDDGRFEAYPVPSTNFRASGVLGFGETEAPSVSSTNSGGVA